MKENWEKLIDILTQLLTLYSTILQFNRQKSASIVAADMREIESLTQKEELLIAQVGKLEASRNKLVRQIAADCGLDGAGLTLAKMAEAADPEFAGRLAGFSKDFSALISELAAINELNTDLIQQALSYVNFNINILSQNVTGPTYAPHGQSADGARAFRLLDRKV